MDFSIPGTKQNMFCSQINTPKTTMKNCQNTILRLQYKTKQNSQEVNTDAKRFENKTT